MTPKELEKLRAKATIARWAESLAPGEFETAFASWIARPSFQNCIRHLAMNKRDLVDKDDDVRAHLREFFRCAYIELVEDDEVVENFIDHGHAGWGMTALAERACLAKALQLPDFLS